MDNPLPNLSLQFPYDIRGRHTSHFFFYLPGYLSLVPPVCSLVPRSICMHAVQLYPSGAHLEALICHCFAALCIEWMCLSMFKWQKLCLLWVPSKKYPRIAPHLWRSLIFIFCFQWRAVNDTEKLGIEICTGKFKCIIWFELVDLTSLGVGSWCQTILYIHASKVRN